MIEEVKVAQEAWKHGCQIGNYTYEGELSRERRALTSASNRLSSFALF